MEFRKHLIFGAITSGILFLSLVETISLYTTLQYTNVSHNMNFKFLDFWEICKFFFAYFYSNSDWSNHHKLIFGNI